MLVQNAVSFLMESRVTEAISGAEKKRTNKPGRVWVGTRHATRLINHMLKLTSNTIILFSTRILHLFSSPEGIYNSFTTNSQMLFTLYCFIEMQSNAFYIGSWENTMARGWSIGISSK